MNVLIVYDVETVTREGQRRLRQVAKKCEGYGQRVQYSVFEVECSRTKLARLVLELEAAMDPALDSIRVYLLDRDGFDRAILLGRKRELSHREAWVL